MAASDLAEAVEARRLELGLSVHDLAEFARVSYLTARRIRAGDPVRALSLAHLDEALQWPVGTTAAHLAGTPVPQPSVDQRAPEPPPITSLAEVPLRELVHELYRRLG